ncbi:hypothetical protein Vadar_025238 [Vaccinium darrowii]|uniref:Uncharacterized protein n=1 Tax=Vaccinium darrowii TaxID=229202 RepID=A0ACB7YY93_9ERIC|nr:hypothetical protein Vadar_025238 [Vaccinium darrowii]
MADSSSSSTSASTTMYTALPPNLSLLISNLSSFITVKLDSSNFLIWKNQFQNILCATNLFGYVDGSTSKPSSTVKDSTGNDLINPEFLMWNSIDAHLLSCITATLTPSIYTSVVHLTHCYEIWSALEKRFTSLSRSHIHQLKNRLNTITKGANTMEDFLRQIQDIAEQLSLASSPIDEEDLVLITLNGLPDEFDAFKTTIRARTEPILMQELSSLLCSEAIHVDDKAKKSTSSDLNVAFASMKGNPSFSSTRGFSSYNRGRSHQYRPNFRGRGFQSSNGGSRGSFRGRNGGQFSGGYSDRFSGSSGSRFSGDRFSGRNGSPGDRFSGGSVVCQICGKFNHTALNCWYRMDESYGATSSESSPKAYAASSSCSSGPNQWSSFFNQISACSEELEISSCS